MDLTTDYLGLKLAHPFIMGASPLVDHMDMVRRLEDGGAAAIVMHSLFEEQIVVEQMSAHENTEPHKEAFAEAMSYLPEATEYELGPAEYLEQVRRVKDAVGIPVIGSLNGVTARGWLEYAKLIEDAGADALELNLYSVNSDAGRDANALESEALQMIRTVKAAVSIPLALKLSPFYTSLSHFIARARAAGADGFVLFNRFYQPDLDLDGLEIVHRIQLSTSEELLLRVRWLAILSAQCSASFAVTGGVRDLPDAIKALMVGADAIQLVSEILRNGPKRFAELRNGLAAWLTEREYTSLDQLRGSMSLHRCPDPAAYERTNYVRTLQGWRGLP